MTRCEWTAYTGSRPGCYKCKEPIGADEDYYVLIWRGKTWETAMNYHTPCFLKAFEDGDFRPPAWVPRPVEEKEE